MEYVVVNTSTNQAGQQIRETFNETRFVSSDGRVRAERRYAANDRLLFVTLHDRNRDESVRLDVQNKTAVRSRSVMARTEAGTPLGSHPPMRGEKESLDTVIVQGFTCQAYRNRFTNGLMIEHSWCQDPVTGQGFLGSMNTYQPGGASVRRQELQKVMREVQADSQLFEIPPDYRIVDQ
ncbi:MAG: hypothetical protein ACRD88_00380 [Terriglobia bacterium]